MELSTETKKSSAPSACPHCKGETKIHKIVELDVDGVEISSTGFAAWVCRTGGSFCPARLPFAGRHE